MILAYNDQIEVSNLPVFRDNGLWNYFSCFLASGCDVEIV
jgi:hypothetical protein